MLVAVVVAASLGCEPESPPDCDRLCGEHFPLYVGGVVCEDGATCSCKMHPMRGGQFLACVPPESLR